MRTVENRRARRENLLILAAIRIDGLAGEQKVQIRNLSSRGLMASGLFPVQSGQLVWIKLNNIGWTEGSVAWVQENRFGIAFRAEVDSSLIDSTNR